MATENLNGLGGADHFGADISGQACLCQHDFEVDLVDVFRRSQDIYGHVEDMLAKRPKAVWFQSGIRNQEIAETLARAGIKVVQDRCLMVEHRSIATR